MTTLGARRDHRRGMRAIAVASLALAALPLTGCLQLLPEIPGLPGTGAEELPPVESMIEGTIEGFQSQEPRWQPCEDGLQCADVEAPLDWSDTGGDRISLSLVKQPAQGGEAVGTLFLNPGGPGASGVDYLVGSVDRIVQEPVREAYDVIAWDPRGVGGSTSVGCLDAPELDEYLFGLSEGEDLEVGSNAWIKAAAEESAEFGRACLERTGPLLAHVDTASTVQDLDMLRAIVGDTKLNYLGFSYGTYIGARYADAYPERVGRLVLDGAIDPSTSEFEVVREQTQGFELALRAYVEDCLSKRSCPFSGSVDGAMQRIGALLDAVDETPLRGSDGRMLSSGTMLTAIITPLYSQSNWPYLDQLFTSVAEGDADVALALADFYYSRENGSYADNSTEAFLAINCLDYPNDLDVNRMRAQAAELEEVAPTIGRFQGYGDIFCAAWPVDGVEERTGVTAAGADPILVVGTTGDPATPYRWAEALAEQLESGVLLTYEGEGHTAYGKNACVDAIVDEYLLTGAVPAGGARCS
ncbi:MAG: alpha/beta hydrolase [Leucobacter sp.]